MYTLKKKVLGEVGFLHARASHVINNLQPSLADDIKSNWLPFSYFYKKSVLMLMHNVHLETSSQSVCGLFSKNATSRSTRFPNQFDIVRFKSDTGRNTFKYQIEERSSQLLRNLSSCEKKAFSGFLFATA